MPGFKRTVLIGLMLLPVGRCLGQPAGKASNPPPDQPINDTWDMPHAANPIIPGYYADPTVLAAAGKYYIYATIDPWGGDTVGCWESSDFKHWHYQVLNWPTKQACTSPTSKEAKVWAPSVVKGSDGRFHMFVSVGSEIWTGVADHPLGPWHNPLGHQPLISAAFNPSYHMIDADAFVDEDGSAYLFWGSGWNWTNGACYGVKLQHDLSGFDGEVKLVTPEHYFEAPTMMKHDGRYYLAYSYGKTISDTYQVRYAVSDHPLGPFQEGATSPILVTDYQRNVISPGHNAFFRQNNHVYIVYGRQRVPFVDGTAFRQVCIDELHFTADGLLEKVLPTHQGPILVQGRNEGRNNLASLDLGVIATASSSASGLTQPKQVLDDNYATRWAAATDARGAWIQIDLGSEKQLQRSEIRFEYAWKPYFLFEEASSDGQAWKTVADCQTHPIVGSPVIIQHTAKARYLRLVFPTTVPGRDISIFEWEVF